LIFRSYPRILKKSKEYSRNVKNNKKSKFHGKRPVKYDEKRNMSTQEEAEIERYLNKMLDRGFGRTGGELLQQVKPMLDFRGRKTRFPDNLPGKKWFRLLNKGTRN